MKFREYKYIRPDIDDVCNRLDRITGDINNLDSLDEVIKAIDEAQKIISNFDTMTNLCMIRNSIDTTDELYIAEQDFFNENTPKFTNSKTKYSKALIANKFRTELEKKYTKQWFSKMEVLIKSFDECIMDELVEEAKLQTEYSKVMASAQIEFDGKVYNLAGIQKLCGDSNRNVRKMAEAKKVDFYLSVEDKIDEIYDKMVHIRDKMAKKLGYNNYVELGYLRLARTDYDAFDVANYRRQVLDDVVPVAKRIVEAQANRLGIKDMKNYDLNVFYSDSDPKPHGDTPVLVNKALEMYNDISKETSEFFKFMVDSELLDLDTKPGKQNGGYCEILADYKAPFIFANSNQTTDDVDTLTHEAGHGFQVYTSSRIQPVFDVYWPTYEAAEIHSMSMEYFAHPYMESFFENEADKYRYKHLADSVTFIPYGVCIDDFQTYVYENPNLTPKERKDYWHKIEEKYTPWKKYDLDFYNRGGIWIRQLHVFMCPFYYIDYTLAQVCAFQFYLLDLANHENAWNKYYELCKLGGSLSFTGLLKAVDLKNPFEKGSLKPIMKNIEKVLTDLEALAIK